jgi:hypothetical protein
MQDRAVVDRAGEYSLIDQYCADAPCFMQLCEKYLSIRRLASELHSLA